MNGPGSDPRSLGSDPRGGGGPRPSTARIQWIAFLFSPFIYWLVGYFVTRGREEAPEAAPWVFPSIAAVAAVIALFAPRFIPAREPAAPGLPTTAQIVAWGLDETVSLVGLVSVLLGGAHTMMVPYVLVSVVLLWVHRPQS